MAGVFDVSSYFTRRQSDLRYLRGPLTAAMVGEALEGHTAFLSGSAIVPHTISGLEIANEAIGLAHMLGDVRPAKIISDPALPLLTPPNPFYPEGALVYWTVDAKLYINRANVWESAVRAPDLSGILSPEQLQGAIQSTSAFASSLRPVELVDALPTIAQTGGQYNYDAGAMVYLKSTGKLYQLDPARNWKPLIKGNDLTGILSLDQLDASIVNTATFAQTLRSVTVIGGGSLPDLGVQANQVKYPAGTTVFWTTDQKTYKTVLNAAVLTWQALVSAGELSGQIVGTQIKDGEIKTAHMLANTIEGDRIKAGTLDASKITADSITAGQIQAGAIGVDELAANSVVVGKVAAGAIMGINIQADAIITAHMTANSISGDRILINSLDASKIVADSITAGQIQAGAITASELAANSVVAGKVAADAILAVNIKAGEIQTGHMAANSINGDRITANTLHASKITANSITSGLIQAGAVTTDKLIVGSFENMVEDASFALPLAPIGAWNVASWSPTSTGTSISPTSPHTGTSCLRMNGDSQWKGVFNRLIFDVRQDESYRLEMWLRQEGVDAGHIYIGLRYYTDRSGSTYVSDQWFWASPAEASNSWTLHTITFVVPAGVRAAHVWLVDDGVATSGAWYVDDVYVRKMVGAAYISDIKADSITSGILNCGNITVSNLSANSITSGTLNCANLTVQNINGASVVDGSIASGKIASLDAGKITAGTMSADRIYGGTINGSVVNVINLNAGSIIAGTLSADRISGGTINGALINVTNLNASNITGGTLSADKISGGTINGALINVTNLNASNITGGTLSADKISGGTINGALINVTNLNASNITGGTLSADRISGGTINGSFVNVTNLNASNITAGTLSIDRLTGWNGANIQMGGGLTFSASDGGYVSVSSGNVTIRNSAGNFCGLTGNSITLNGSISCGSVTVGSIATTSGIAAPGYNYVNGGVTKYCVTDSVPYLRPDSTTGYMLFYGGVYCGRL